MATTMYFAKTIQDKKENSAKLELEFGRSSFYGENLMYVSVDGKKVIMDKATGKEIFNAMRTFGVYLGYEKD